MVHRPGDPFPRGRGQDRAPIAFCCRNNPSSTNRTPLPVPALDHVGDHAMAMELGVRVSAKCRGGTSRRPSSGPRPGPSSLSPCPASGSRRRSLDPGKRADHGPVVNTAGVGTRCLVSAPMMGTWGEHCKPRAVANRRRASSGIELYCGESAPSRRNPGTSIAPFRWTRPMGRRTGSGGLERPDQPELHDRARVAVRDPGCCSGVRAGP